MRIATTEELREWALLHMEEIRSGLEAEGSDLESIPPCMILRSVDGKHFAVNVYLLLSMDDGAGGILTTEVRRIAVLKNIIGMIFIAPMVLEKSRKIILQGVFESHLSEPEVYLSKVVNRRDGKRLSKFKPDPECKVQALLTPMVTDLGITSRVGNQAN